MDDYKNLQRQIEDGEKVLWDKDHREYLKKGCYIGFIVGCKGEEMVEVYEVIDEADESMRDKQWCNDTPWTTNNGKSNVGHRDVIVLASKFAPFGWNWWKEQCGYKEKYTPRGTTRSRNPLQ